MTAIAGLYVVEAHPMDPAVVQAARRSGIGTTANGHLSINPVLADGHQVLFGGDNITAWVGALRQEGDEYQLTLAAEQTAVVPGTTQIIKVVTARIPRSVVESIVLQGPAVTFQARAETTFAGVIDVIVKLRLFVQLC